MSCNFCIYTNMQSINSLPKACLGFAGLILKLKNQLECDILSDLADTTGEDGQAATASVRLGFQTRLYKNIWVLWL